MNKVDMLVVEVKDGKGTVTDLWSVSEDTPKIDK